MKTRISIFMLFMLLFSACWSTALAEQLTLSDMVTIQSWDGERTLPMEEALTILNSTETPETLTLESETPEQEAQRTMGDVVDPIDFRVPSLSSSVSQSDVAEKAALPSAYDSREYGYIGAVRDQNPYGTCWAHATIASAESYMRSHYGMPESLDYSELQLLLNMHARPDDPLGLISKDTDRILWLYKDELPDWLDIGGNQNRATAMLSSWAGVTNETVDDGANQLSSYTKLSGVLNGSSIANKKADLALRFNSPIGFEYDAAHMFDSEWIDRSTIEGIEAVKKAIKDNGEVGIRYVHDDFFVNFEDPTTSTGKTYYYCPFGATMIGGGHAVSVVGWDDSIPKENFKIKNYMDPAKPTIMPEKDGAWLVRNSWNSNWGDKGYFWMSYETINTGRKTAYADEYRPASWFEHNYQYDGATMDNDFIDDNHPAYVAMANVFTAQDNEEIRATSFSLLGSDISYKIEIYTDVRDGDDPTAGTLAAVVDGSDKKVNSGFHTIELPEDQRVFAAKGTKFSVVVILTSTADPQPVTTDDCFSTIDGVKENNGKCPAMLLDCSYSYSGDTEYVNYMEAGQSYYLQNTTWVDLLTKSKDFYNGQPRIKAFTVGTSEPLSFSVAPGDGYTVIRWNAKTVSKDVDALSRSDTPIRIYRSESPDERGKMIAEVKGVNAYLDYGPFTAGVDYRYTASVGSAYNPTCALKNGQQVDCLEAAPADHETFADSEPVTIKATEQMANPRGAYGITFWNTWAKEDRKLPGTGFASGHFTALSAKPQGLTYGNPGLKLEIPGLDVSETIMTVPLTENNYEVEWLGSDIGLLEGSALPGEGISLLAAHNHLNTDAAGPFAFLSDLKENDRIFIQNGAGEVQSFKVYANAKIVPDDFDTLSELTHENALVLITCEDEIVSGGYAARRVVFAEMTD